jgi:hypothetical protein
MVAPIDSIRAPGMKRAKESTGFDLSSIAEHSPVAIATTIFVHRLKRED